MADRARSLVLVALATLSGGSCVQRSAPVSTETQLAIAVTALREGRLEAASELIVAARRLDPGTSTLRVRALCWLISIGVMTTPCVSSPLRFAWRGRPVMK